MPSDSSIVLKTQLSASESLERGVLPVRPGYVRFEIDTHEEFRSSVKTEWMQARPETDYAVQKRIGGLTPDTRYYYRAIVGPDTQRTFAGETRRFKTLPPPSSSASVDFVVASCMHYDRFMMGKNQDLTANDARVDRPARGEDRRLGYPAFASIDRLDPDFYVSNGDNVYYDSRHWQATTSRSMRHEWHQLFALPRFQRLLGSTASYWMKDDHDFRYDEADTTNTRRLYPGGAEPSYEQGIRIFREQVPATTPDDPNRTTYRTYRVGQLLQIWMLEGRDYRSPNQMEDGPEKSLWGPKQKTWLKQTLRESDAPFKLLISPTPLVGPDSDHKRDNHTNTGGFRHERDAFFDWLIDHGFKKQNVYVITGDRHWQYHSIHPTGFEEFSSGSFMVQNSRVGPSPGESGSTDPEGLIEQPYKPSEPMGGFLRIKLDAEKKALSFSFYDEGGEVQYESVKRAQ